MPIIGISRYKTAICLSVFTAVITFKQITVLIKAASLPKLLDRFFRDWYSWIYLAEGICIFFWIFLAKLWHWREYEKQKLSRLLDIFPRRVFVQSWVELRDTEEKMVLRKGMRQKCCGTALMGVVKVRDELTWSDKHFTVVCWALQRQRNELREGGEDIGLRAHSTFSKEDFTRRKILSLLPRAPYENWTSLALQWGMPISWS